MKKKQSKFAAELAKLSPDMMKIYKEILKFKNIKPNISRILLAQIDVKEKYACLEIYKNMLETKDKEVREDLNSLLNEILAPKKYHPFIEKFSRMLDGYSADDMPFHIREIIQSKIDMMKESDPESSTFGNLREYLTFALSLPYNRKKDFLNGMSRIDFLRKVKLHLDENLYGMEKVKEQLLLALNNKLSNPESPFSLAFSGAPGVGKTRIASVFAEAIGFPIEKISLGGLHDASIFKGSEKHWSGSSPGILLQIMSRMKISNGIILFDEIDKLNGHRGYDVVNALLHITDYTQNHEIGDSFISEFSHDVSNCIFFFSMNNETEVNPILLDRLNIITIESYTLDEIAHIAHRHSFPKEFKNCKLDLKYAPSYEDVHKLVKVVYGSTHAKCGARKIEKIVKFIVTCFNFEICTGGTSHNFLSNTAAVSGNGGAVTGVHGALTFEIMQRYNKIVKVDHENISISHLYL